MTKHLTDPDPKRATYQVTYPTAVISFGDAENFQRQVAENRLFADVKIKFGYTKANNTGATFDRCQLYFDNEEAKIEQLTFRDCNFHSCFLGTVEFLNTRFERCAFTKCDFSNSRFENCVFDRCTFDTCSAYHPDFINTEIDQAFINSLVLLERNYTSVSSQIRDSFIYAKLSVAKKLYNSNNSIDSHSFSDQALHALKRVDLQYHKRLIRQDWNNCSVSGLFFNGIYICFKSANLLFTNGGTSLLKILLWSVCFILSINFYFSASDIADGNYLFPPSSSAAINYLKWIPRTTSIFLGYGYTAYTAFSWWQHFWVNLCVLFGLFSYAMVISVLIRKVYK